MKYFDKQDPFKKYIIKLVAPSIAVLVLFGPKDPSAAFIIAIALLGLMWTFWALTLKTTY
jgi:hypothetical protein